jgi:hypothetical protein
MNIILLTIIFIIIVYTIYITNTNTEISNITDTNTEIETNTDIDNFTDINNLNLNNINNTNDFELPEEINYNNNEALSYMPDETTCSKKLINILKELIYNGYNYKLIGTAINKYYNQKYYLYESKIDQYGDLLMRDNLDYLNEQIYSYIFVTFINNKIEIDHEFGPRNKIDIGDIIYLDKKYLSNGISYIGPYIIM